MRAGKTSTIAASLGTGDGLLGEEGQKEAGPAGGDRDVSGPGWAGVRREMPGTWGSEQDELVGGACPPPCPTLFSSLALITVFQAIRFTHPFTNFTFY